MTFDDPSNLDANPRIDLPVGLNKVLADVTRATKALSPLFASIRAIAATMPKIPVQVSQTLAKVFDSGLPQRLREFQRNLEYWRTEAPQQLKEAISQGGYLPSLQLSFLDLAAVIKAYRDNGTQEAIATLDRLHDALFADPTFLNDLGRRWSTTPALKHRTTPLLDALKAHEAALYGASTPTLLAQTEGIIVDLVGHQGRCGGAELKGFIDKLTKDDPYFGPTVRAVVSEVILKGFAHGDQLPEFSRHAILHGADTSYAIEAVSRKAILYVDYLCELALLSADPQVEPND